MKTKKQTPFTNKVLSWIQKIPKGKVATYSQIAALSGKPGATRGVVWILNSCSESHSLPWFRVINAKGKISFAEGSINYKKQRSLLLKDGVKFRSEQEVDLELFQWSKSVKAVQKKSSSPKMFT